MKHIKKFEHKRQNEIDVSDEYQNKIQTLRIKVQLYLRNKDNFPDNENIKDIFEDINDWLYININSWTKIHIYHNLYRLNKNEDKAFNLQNEIRNNTTPIARYKVWVDKIKKETYYKSYRINLEIFNTEEYLNMINIALKKLSSKFLVRKYGPSSCGFDTTEITGKHFYIYIIDTSEPVTLQEIINITPEIKVFKKIQETMHKRLIIHYDKRILLNKYINNKDNFPKMDDVKIIFENLTDWCYLKGYYQLVFKNEISRIGDQPMVGENLKIFSLSDQLDTKDESKIYYTTYKIIFKFQLFRNEIWETSKDEIEFNKLLDPIYKRLSNYGFTVIKKQKEIGCYACINLIDKTEPITLKEILEAK